MEKHLIIARYREDAGWLEEVDFPVYLYDKSYKAHVVAENDHIIQQTIPNIGREAHTYNQYIIDNYESLPEVCIFSQCDPFAHVENFIDIIKLDSLDDMWNENLKDFPDSPIRHDGFLGLGTYSFLNLHAARGEEEFWWLKFKAKEIYKKLFASPLPDSWYTSHGAIIVVAKENILQHPKELYENMMQLHENTNFPAFDWSNETAVAFEHLWTIIFKKEARPLATGPHIDAQDWLI